MFDQSYSYLMYDEVDDYEWFIQEATDYIAAHPDCHHGYNNRAIAYFELGKLEKALDDFKLAIEIAQDQDIQPLKNRGHMFEQTNRLEFAICDYNSAIQLAPKNPYVRRARALAWMKKLDFMAAIYDSN